MLQLILNQKEVYVIKNKVVKLFVSVIKSDKKYITRIVFGYVLYLRLSQ